MPHRVVLPSPPTPLRDRMNSAEITTIPNLGRSGSSEEKGVIKVQDEDELRLAQMGMSAWRYFRVLALTAT